MPLVKIQGFVRFYPNYVLDYDIGSRRRSIKNFYKKNFTHTHTHTQNVVRTPLYWEGEASVSLILEAVSEIRTLLFKNISSKDDKLIPLTMLKDSFPLAEKMS